MFFANETNRHPSSFKDPSGYVYISEGHLFRTVMPIYMENYEHLFSSGLYDALTAERLLVKHSEVASADNKISKIIKPEYISFISYPYEWCFGQYKDAALLTLKIQRIALAHGMTLKDASPFNVQFLSGVPIFIDSLSFEKYQEGSPWGAYKQFCEMFLAPLALCSYVDLRLSNIIKSHINGIPLDLASKLLPLSSWFSFSILSHIHLHAHYQSRYSDKNAKTANMWLSKSSLLALIDSLVSAISNLAPRKTTTTWAKYYSDKHNYSDTSFEQKKALVSSFLNTCAAKIVWDIGANEGIFSRIAASRGAQVLSMDNDPIAVESNYQETKTNRESGIMPLLLDITNPSPGLGFNNTERHSLTKRQVPDTILALALIHHLVIGSNIPFDVIARFFANISKWLIIEFVPKEDSQTQKLLLNRKDIFHDYNFENFESSFGRHYSVKLKQQIQGSMRVLYLMGRHED